jgi:tetratricopeptide (TPR) repeat protein
MKLNRPSLIPILVLLASFAAWPVFGESRIPIDQVPMYGGMDRNAVPELKSGDENFISSVVAEFGTREKASSAWVNRGFTLYQQDDLAGAMRRFNQAWLLNPSNPEVYWGFASILTDQQKFCEALKMVKTAETKGALQPGFLPDAALVYTGCAIEDKSLDPAVREAYLSRSDELFSQAFESPAVRKEYTLFHWARAMYGREDYSGAWEKVAQFRKETGKDIDPRFIRSLSQKMAEPK